MSVSELSLQESSWLQKNKAAETFVELELLLRDICNRLNVSSKVENYGGNPPPHSSQTEKFVLISRVNQDALKATVTLLDENIVQSEISLKHAKVPGGIFRSVANPNVQWKIQQLQDTGNQCARALQIIIKVCYKIHETLLIKKFKGKQRYEKCVQKNGFDSQSEQLLLGVLQSVKSLVSDARTCLTMPRKKSLLELCQFQPTKSFNPPLPHDILLSYYISSTKLVCAAYQVVTMKQNGTQSVSVYQAEAHLPHLVDVLHHLNAIFSRVQDLTTKFNLLKLRTDSL